MRRRSRLLIPSQPSLITRRTALGLLSAAGFASSATNAATPNSCVLIPEETEGPFPLYDDIDDAGAALMRRDIAEDRPGIPLDLQLTVSGVGTRCTPLVDALVYVWHCDKGGLYSGYRGRGMNSAGATYCRGIQKTDNNGRVNFRTIYPGWYWGRITHIHFRVYLRDNLAATSQMAFPQDITAAVYKSPLYALRGPNPTVSGFDDDSEFHDGVEHQLCTTTRTADGYAASLNVGIAV